MPDISLCTDSKCPARVSCYRYRAKPGEWQTYTDFARNGNRCESFLPIYDADTIRPVEEIEPSVRKNASSVE